MYERPDKRKDKKYLSLLFQVLSELTETGKSEIEFKKADINFLFSIRARMENETDRNLMNNIIDDLRENKKSEIELSINDAGFIRRQVAIIYKNK